MFKRIETTKEIEATLRLYLSHKRPAPFLATIKDRARNMIYESARPLSVATDADGQLWVLTNSDSRYSAPIGAVRLADIEYVETIPRSWMER